MNRLKGAGTSGCCPCNEFVNCDCGPVSCSVECQSKSAAGVATLIGFAEFTAPSSPPKMFRNKKWTGGWERCNFNNYVDCNNGVSMAGADGHTHTLNCQYDKTTGALTYTGSNVTRQDVVAICPATTTILTLYDCAAVLAPPSGNFGVTINRLIQYIYIKGQCLLNGIVYSQVASGGAAINLSDEDTEDDAIARADATVPSWSPCVTGCIACPSY